MNMFQEKYVFFLSLQNFVKDLSYDKSKTIWKITVNKIEFTLRYTSYFDCNNKLKVLDYFIEAFEAHKLEVKNWNKFFTCRMPLSFKSITNGEHTTTFFINKKK